MSDVEQRNFGAFKAVGDVVISLPDIASVDRAATAPLPNSSASLAPPAIAAVNDIAPQADAAARYDALNRVVRIAHYAIDRPGRRHREAAAELQRLRRMAMKPLGLKEIADVADIHESAVSRVTNDKFEYGHPGLIKHMVEAEAREAPLSAAKIARQLMDRVATRAGLNLALQIEDGKPPGLLEYP